MLNGMFGKMAEESIYQRKMIKKSKILSIKNLVNKKYLELYLKDTINELRLLEINRKARKKYKTDYA